MKLNLRGIIPPMVTPLKADGSLDEEGLKNLIEHLISGGVHGIFLLGTNGEATSLTHENRKKLVSKACHFINKRVPVLVGISDTVLEDSVAMCDHAKSCGADAVVIAPPYYLPISEDEFLDFMQALVPQLSLPFVLYNMPSCTKLHLSVPTVKKIKDLGAIGIKDSSGDLDYLLKLISEFKSSPDFAIIAGTESFLSTTILHGGHGAVAGGANFFPKLFVELYNASLIGELLKVEQLNEEVNKLYHTIYNVGSFSSKITKGTKCALAVLNICEDHMALPLKKFSDIERHKIATYVQSFQQTLAL
ncbi:dihydrodipicolinate synthase family protein [Cytophaga sp. FL35]|uniref:dihydrodipicolinate synthase family protein n=1 Tax=Cytophaga sp. FL35 TaxID=1904456 RepID=UPI00165387AD|nr:dihydrodipicolinate synthase family protein [Cytophaga sp. FL35]MBC6998924.1 dihydrodipicolinate synthase family protein [Cytophaga sp. FL35]